jgi:hypothetical protein
MEAACDAYYKEHELRDKPVKYNRNDENEYPHDNKEEWDTYSGMEQAKYKLDFTHQEGIANMAAGIVRAQQSVQIANNTAYLIVVPK